MLIGSVDDIIVTSNDENGIKEPKAYLGRKLEINDLEELKYFIGIEVKRYKRGILISQCNYTSDLLGET